MAKNIKMGVIGCGQFMSQQHIQTINRSKFLTLQHLADRAREKVECIARKYNAARYSTDWRSVVTDPEVDVVVVGVVPEVHPEIAQAALENNKPVYIEKPLGPTPQKCLSIQRMAWQRKIPLAVGFNRRFGPATKLLAEAFQSAGPPVSVLYRISDDDRIRPPNQNWKLGCRLLMEVVHIFDLLTFLIGAEPINILARESRYNDTMVLLEFENGSRATILSSSYGSMAQPKEHLEAILNRGAVEMDDFVEFRSFGVSGVPGVQYFAGRAYDDCDNSHVEAFAECGLEALTRLSFCIAATDGTKPKNANALDGNRATSCAIAARKSIETSRIITLNSKDWSM